MSKKNILIIDDDVEILKLLKDGLSGEYNVEVVSKGNQGLELLKSDIYDVCLLDLVLPDISGIEILQEIKNLPYEVSVIVITGYPTIESAVETIKEGASDFVKKPFSIEEIKYLIQKVIKEKEMREEFKSLKSHLAERFNFSGIIGKNKEMKEVVKLIQQIAPTDAFVLITGESGTGKELVAKAIHYNSLRKDYKFVAINCGALPDTLLESELFGYKKGAFTGASASKKGLFEVADGGTVFLDEIGNTSESFQSKLLRFLDTGIFYPLGGTQSIKTDVRIISATNTIIENKIRKKEFREDLYYRLNVVRIELPPLRNRREDIPLLIDHFISLYNKKYDKDIKGVSLPVMEYLMNYSWPGNIRELQNAIEHSVILCKSDEIKPRHLPDSVKESGFKQLSEESLLYKNARDAFEREYLVKLLKRVKGNITEASKIAGIARQSIYDKINKLGLRKEKVYYTE